MCNGNGWIVPKTRNKTKIPALTSSMQLCIRGSSQYNEIRKNILSIEIYKKERNVSLFADVFILYVYSQDSEETTRTSKFINIIGCKINIPKNQ